MGHLEQNTSLDEVMSNYFSDGKSREAYRRLHAALVNHLEPLTRRARTYQEDVREVALIQIWQRLEAMEQPPERPGDYIDLLTRNAMAEYIAHNVHPEEVPLADARDVADGAESSFQITYSHEQKERVTRFLMALHNTQHSEIAMLRWCFGQTAAQIAAEMAMDLPAVEHILRSLHEKIRVHFQQP